MKNNEKGFGLLEGLVILVILAAIGFAGWYVFHKKHTTDKKQTSQTYTSKLENSAAKQEQTPVKQGTIQGQVSYPAESLPEDEEICAQNTKSTSAAPICSTVGKNKTLQYTMQVPADTYYVYAQTSRQPGYKAYYNEFVKCGASVSCPSEGHTQYIPVVVPAGGTVEDVNPGDWYNF